MALEKLGSTGEGRKMGMVLGNGKKVCESGGIWVCKGWEVMVVSGLEAHLGLEGPLQGAKGDSRREARR